MLLEYSNLMVIFESLPHARQCLGGWDTLLNKIDKDLCPRIYIFSRGRQTINSQIASK